ncbi:hypothetical protein QFC19_001350 [Naganishia cerealis]|uniref:Uncharacterized protein n=1 Tax=Naganishia cerealis TaxID=610337 RepID=A0ACC2WHD1_9TREE|nr:hypothetical protein QFC19_001350 [Naganishia cerealis]
MPDALSAFLARPQQQSFDWARTPAEFAQAAKTALGVADHDDGVRVAGTRTTAGNLGCPAHPLPPLDDARPPAAANAAAEAQRDRHTRVLRVVWEFIIQTMHHSYGPVGIPPPGTAAQLFDDAFGVRGRHHSNGHDQNVSLDDQRPEEPISLILWADEKHTAREVKRQLGIATGYSVAEIETLMQALEKDGRCIMVTTTDTDLLLHLGQTLGQMDLTISNTRASRVYNECLLQCALGLLLELCDTSHKGDETYWCRLMGEIIVKQPSQMPDPPDHPIEPTPHDDEYARLTHLEWTMRCFPRLWRGARITLVRILSKLFAVAGQQFRNDLAHQFARNYTTLVNHLVARDREPEYALVLWGTHLLSRPLFAVTAAAASSPINDHQMLCELARVLTSYFTDQKVAGQGLIVPPRPVSRIMPEAEAFKSKKWQIMFKHLKTTLRQPPVQRWLVTDPTTQRALLDFLWLWRGISSFVRQVRDHVEYENDGWMRVVTVIVDVAAVAHAFGRSFQYGSVHDNLGILRTVADRIVHDLKTSVLTLNNDNDNGGATSGEDGIAGAHTVKQRWTTKTAQWGPNQRTILAVTVGRAPVSPFNPCHWFMAEVLRQTGRAYARAIVTGEWEHWSEPDKEMWLLSESEAQGETELDNLLLMEKPLQSVVFMAQLRSNMWVRNGQNIRGLLIHYRETYLRDDGYDNDLLLLQYGMTKLDPGTFIISLLERFGMLLSSNLDKKIAANPGKWSLLDHVDREQGIPTAAVIQLCTMLEELLGLVIVLLTEVAGLNGVSDRELIRRALIHLLCFGPLPWSEIVRAVPERMCENIEFISILRHVAELKFPQGKTETGHYHLRKECFAEIDPYFYHYTRNQQQQAYEILLKKRSVRVIRPVPVSLPDAPHPFAKLHQPLQSPFVIDLVYFSLWKAVELDVKQMTKEEGDPQFIPTIDGMIELALQLALVALVNDPASTVKFVVGATHWDMPEEKTLLGLLRVLKGNTSKSAFWPRIDLIMDLVEQHAPGATLLPATAGNGAEPVSNALVDEARKVKNKKRQAGIMAQFAKNQQAALDAFDDEKEDMDEDSLYGNCIVCQEECRASRPSGVLAYIQPSKTIRNLVVHKDWYEEILRTPTNLDQAGESEPAGMSREPVSTDVYPDKHQRFGLHASSCGHMMHEPCLQGFVKNTRARQLSQGQRNHPENSWRGEFLCPLCKSLSNMLLPLDPPLLESQKSPNNTPVMRANLANAIRQVSDESLKHTDETRIAFRRQHAHAAQIIPCFATSDRVLPRTKPGEEDFLQACRLQMLKRFMEITIPISDQTAFMQKRVDDCGIYLPQDLLAYSIASVEIASRGQPTSSQQEFTTEATERMIYGVIVLLREKMAYQEFPIGDETVGRIGIFTRLLPDWFRPRPLQMPLLSRDALTIVIEAAITCQQALSPVILLCYHVELCRAMLAITFWARLCASSAQDPIWNLKPLDDEEFATAQAIFPEARSLLLNFYRHTPQLYHEALSALTAIPEPYIAKFLYTFTLPFLRRCTILSQALKHTNPDADRPIAGLRRDEYTRYLNAFSILPPGRSLFQNSNAAMASAKLNGTEPLSGIIGGWLKQWISNKQQLPVLEYPGIYELYRLPESLTGVFRIGLNRKCNKCKGEPAHPALCLFCGRFLCLGTDCCAEGELGECNLHRMECGGSVGLFVDVKRWALLYLFAGSGTFGPLPYLDTHGEVDQGAR